jgi:hypothetical protein
MTGLVLLASLLGCRRGTVAGAGASCDDRHPCRLGYVCQASGCEVDEAHAQDAASDRSMGQPPSNDGAGVDPDGRVDRPVDAPPAPPPALERCSEYDLDGHPAVCDPMRAASAVEMLDLSPSGRLALRGGGMVNLFQLDGGSFTPIGLPFRIPNGQTGSGNVALSPDGDLLAADGYELTIWRASTGQRELSISRVPNPAYLIAFAPDNDHLLVGLTPRLWSVSKHAPEEALPISYNSGIVYDRWAQPDQPWWAALLGLPRTDAGVTPPGLTFVELRPGGALVTAPVELGPISNRPTQLELGPGATSMAVARDDGIRIWDTSDKTAPRPPATALRAVATDETVRFMRFFPSGRHLLVVTQPALEAGNEAPYNELTILALDTGATVGHRRVEGSIPRLALTGDGRGLLAVSTGCRTVLYCRD